MHLLLAAILTPEALTNLLIAAVVALLFGSVTASMLSHFLTGHRADKEYRLKKLEELYNLAEVALRAYQALFSFCKNNTDRYTVTNAVYENSEEIIKRYDSPEPSYTIMKVIVNLYFNDELLPAYKYAYEARIAYRKVAKMAIQDCQETRGKGNYEYLANELAVACDNVLKSHEEFIERLLRNSIELRQEPVIAWLKRMIHG